MSMNLSRVAIAGMVAMAQSAGAAIVEALPSISSPFEAARKRHQQRSGALYVSAWSYPSGPGWSVAKVKRMANKRRNQARHRRNCRKGR